jgi:hypothetical protein
MNILGGKNESFAYAPLSEDEQDAINRLIDANDLQIEVVGFGMVNIFDRKPVLGDAVLSIDFTIPFTKPEFYLPVYYLDLSLQIRTGEEIFRQKLSLGDPIMVKSGEVFSMNWVIQFKKLDPFIVKRVKSGTVGLTNRYDGSWKLTEDQRELFRVIEAGKANIEKLNKQDLDKALSKEKESHTAIKNDNEKRIIIPVSSK